MIDPVRPAGATAAESPFSATAADATTRTLAPGGTTETGVDFGTMLLQLTTDAANVVRQAEATSVAGVQGKASVQQVVEAVMAAEQTLQGAVAIRDKVVAAYLELSRMQI